MGMLIHNPASISSTVQSMKVVRDVPVRLPSRSDPNQRHLRSFESIADLPIVYIRMNRAILITTQASPRPKQDSTANFSVFRICSRHTHLTGSATIMRSVTMFDMIRHFSNRIWSMQCPMRLTVHCCAIGSHRKRKMKLKTMAQMMTMAPTT